MGYDEDDWRLKTNEELAEEVALNQNGCGISGCNVCASNRAFIVVLRERLGVE